jgi:hypothetical protein
VPVQNCPAMLPVPMIPIRNRLAIVHAPCR